MTDMLPFSAIGPNVFARFRKADLRALWDALHPAPEAPLTAAEIVRGMQRFGTVEKFAEHVAALREADRMARPIDFAEVSRAIASLDPRVVQVAVESCAKRADGSRWTGKFDSVDAPLSALADSCIRALHLAVLGHEPSAPASEAADA